MDCKIYTVGGFVRDQLLERESNDQDFTFVIDEADLTLEEGFDVMRQYMLDNGFTIFLETPECVTIRGKMPDGTVGDFVLARKELGYIEGTRRPNVELGTLRDDLTRRDFTINALARDSNGDLIDLFEGVSDIARGILRTPLDPMVTLTDDPLRALRAVRFAIVLDFRFSAELGEALHNPKLPELMNLVSTDRIRQELTKCFKYSNWKTFQILNTMPPLLVRTWLDRKDLWLKPTTEKSNNG